MEPIGELRISVFILDDTKRPSISISLGGKQRLLESGVHKSYASEQKEISLTEAGERDGSETPKLNVTQTYVSLWKAGAK